jgi:hypothetical protein
MLSSPPLLVRGGIHALLTDLLPELVFTIKNVSRSQVLVL